MAEDIFDFDPNGFDEDGFDPNGFDEDGFNPKRKKAASKSQLTQLTLAIANATANDLNSQLFAPSWGIAAMIKDTGLYPTFLPGTADTLLAAVNLNSRFYFDQNGNLIVKDAAGANLTISCNELPYRALLNYITTSSFMLKRIRYSTTNENNYDKVMYFKLKTMFGKVEQDQITPRMYVDPNQFQTKIADIPLDMMINASKAIEHVVIAGATSTFNITITGVSRNYK